MTKKSIVFLVLILMIATFARFYRLNHFLYFTGDEEIFHSMVKKVTIDRKPPLVIPNAQIGGSMGSFFILLISPFFALANNDPLKVQVIGPFIGLFTTLMMFWAGNLIAGKKVGFLAALLYSSSFIVAIFDRRLWTLTLDPLMIVLSIGSLTQIVNKNYKYGLLLAIALSFTWHSDPAIAVAIIASILVFIFYKISIWKKEFIPAGVYLLLSFLPLVIFELRHPGTIFRPWVIHLTQRSVIPTSLVSRLASINFITTIQNLSRSLFAQPTSSIEEYFCYCDKYPTPLFSPFPEILTVSILIFCIAWVIKTKNKLIKNNLKILFIFLVAFLFGIAIYTLTFSFAVYQHYYITIFPTFILLAAFTLGVLLEKWPIPIFVFLLFFVITNLWVMSNSSLRFPLWEKMDLVRQTIPSVGKSNFSVYGFGNHSLYDGGWVTLYLSHGLNPQRSYLNSGWDFLYRTHSLYSYNPNQGDGEKIIIFRDIEDDRLIHNESFKKKSIANFNFGRMSVVILDNKDDWFNIKLLQW